MELPIIDNTDAYIDVCKKAGLPVNKLPKKGDKIDLAYEIAMKTINPALYQNLMSPSPDDLPADVSKRYKQGLLWIDDLKAYEDCGFSGTANYQFLVGGVLKATNTTGTFTLADSDEPASNASVNVEIFLTVNVSQEVYKIIFL